MPEIDVLGANSKVVGKAALEEAIFGAPLRKTLVWEDVRHYLAMQRQGTHSTKTRAEVSGGGRKPWRQKGTGRARHGSIRSPIWRKGGITFGPKPRDYGYHLPKKKRWGALCSALSDKFRGGALMVVEDLKMEEPKARLFRETLKKLGLGDGRKILLVDEARDTNLLLSARNMPNVVLERPMALRSYPVLDADVVVFTRSALDTLTREMPK
jgi:large subunit ribosomal protein L4